jgi:formiminoglutamase
MPDIFSLYQPCNIEPYLSKRRGETKLGEHIQTISDWHELSNSSCPFVVVGIPEDIGVRANFGIGGTHTAWSAFLQAFLNIQENVFLSGELFLILGAFNFEQLMAQSRLLDPHNPDELEQLRQMVAQIDDLVAPVIQKIVEVGKFPFIIGGGHNNAFPIIKGASQALKSPISCLNIDAHADFRSLEGRHSGNGFRYAMEAGFLQKYGAFGLHESYNPDFMLQDMTQSERIHFTTFDQILFDPLKNIAEYLDEHLRFLEGAPIGFEFDLDATEHTLASAMSPTGFSMKEARLIVHRVAQSPDVCYVHFCEGANALENGQTSPTIGKKLAYLISDFVKAKKVSI